MQVFVCLIGERYNSGLLEIDIGQRKQVGRLLVQCVGRQLHGGRGWCMAAAAQYAAEQQHGAQNGKQFFHRNPSLYRTSASILILSVAGGKGGVKQKNAGMQAGVFCG